MSVGRQDSERQCVACRKRAAPEQLVRVVRSPSGELVVDLRARLPGRGAWLHLHGPCLGTVESKPDLLQRALRGPVSVQGVQDAVVASVQRAALDGLSLASAGGGLVGGHDRLVSALQAGEITELLFASDASERTVDSLLTACPPDVPSTRLTIDRNSLGAQVGAGSRAALGLLPTPSCTHLRRQLQRLRLLG